MDSKPVLFALEGSQAFGHAVASQLGISLAAHEDRAFEDGEHKSRPLESMRGRDVYVLHTLFGPGEPPPGRVWVFEKGLIET